MRFLSVSHSAKVLLVRWGLFNPAESFVHAQNLEWTPLEKGARWMYGSYALACVLFGTQAFLVLYLSSLHPLMSSGPDSWPNYYPTCNWSTRDVPDIDRMFSGRLLQGMHGNWWLMGVKRWSTGPNWWHIFWGIIKRGLPVSLSPV